MCFMSLLLLAELSNGQQMVFGQDQPMDSALTVKHHIIIHHGLFYIV